MAQVNSVSWRIWKLIPVQDDFDGEEYEAPPEYSAT